MKNTNARKLGTEWLQYRAESADLLFLIEMRVAALRMEQTNLVTATTLMSQGEENSITLGVFDLLVQQYHKLGAVLAAIDAAV